MPGGLQRPRAQVRQAISFAKPANPANRKRIKIDRGLREFKRIASDNTASICPEAWDALQEANVDAAPSYGEDRWTARVWDLVRQVFETDCEVFLVLNGTAADALGASGYRGGRSKKKTKKSLTISRKTITTGAQVRS